MIDISITEKGINMKQKFVSKIKRFAIAMLAALCVGNVWGTYITVDVSNVAISETGALTFQYRLGYWESDTDRYGYLKVDLLDPNDGVVKTHEIIKKSDENQLVEKGYDSSAPISTTIEGVGELTGCSTLEALWEAGYAVLITFRSFKSGKDFDYGDYELLCKDSGVTWSEATFSTRAENGKVIPTGFLVSGTYNKAKGINRIEIHYVLNKGTSNEKEDDVEAVLNATEGTFECSIPCENVNDKLSYIIRAVFDDGSSALYRDSSTGKTEGLGEMHEGYATYTWTGECDDKWDMPGNWSYIGQSYYGYPGKKDGGWYLAVAQFTDDAAVDLNGGTFGLKDEYRGFIMSSGITVKLENGTILFEPSNSTDYPWAVVPANSTLILKDVAMPYRAEAPDTEYVLRLVSGSTLILEGNKVYNWRLSPKNANTRLKVQNGTIQTKYDPIQTGKPGNGTEVEIENGVWVVKTNTGRGNMNCPDGLAMRTIFRDGPDRRAQLMFRDSATGSTYYTLKLVGTYDFKPSNKYEAKYLTTPYLVAGGLITGDACTISVDVSDLEGYAKIPLMKFTSGGGNVTTAMNMMVNDESKLTVTANGRNVKTRQRARLVWDATAKTLYYEQDPVKGFRVIVR